MTNLQIRNESDRNKAMGYIAGLDLAKPKKLAITEVDRSGEQNKALHAALADIAAQVEHAGKKWDVLIWKRLLTAAWLRESGDQPQMIPAVDGNGFDVIYERTSKLTVKQCGELIEWVHAFGAEHQSQWLPQRNRREVLLAGAVEADREEACIVHLVQRAVQVRHLDDRDKLKRAGG